MILVESGRFLRGARAEDLHGTDVERPAYSVTIESPFYLGRTEVTQQQWAGVICGAAHGSVSDPAKPVAGVTWAEVQRFLFLTNLRLPTETEWEYACRADSNAMRYGMLDDIAWHAGNSNSQVHLVGEKAPNAWGLCDMLGNVAEWVADINDGEFAQSLKDRFLHLYEWGQLPHVVRGGSWESDQSQCRATSRRVALDDWIEPDVGFRVACDP